MFRRVTPLCFSLLLSIGVCSVSLSAEAADIRAQDVSDIERRTDTPSTFPVPRYVSLKYGKAYGRTGPSRDHPVKWMYERKGLPLIVVAETATHRKVRDPDGEEVWMAKRLLDGRRTVVTLQQIKLHAKAREDSKVRAVVEADVILDLEECDSIGWCKVRASTGHEGYALLRTLWGAKPI